MLIIIFAVSGASFGSSHSKKQLVQWSDFTTAPIKPYIILGFGEALVATATYYSYTYLPGKVVVLVSQGSVPLAAFGYNRDHLHKRQKIGSVMVIIGLIVIFLSVFVERSNADRQCLPIDDDKGTTCTICDDYSEETDCVAPQTGDNNDYNGSVICKWAVDDDSYDRTFVWMAILCATAVPMTLSSFYKLRYMPEENSKKHPLFNIAMTSFFAIPFTLLLTLGFGDISTPSVAVDDWNSNIGDGSKCLRGTDTIETGCVVDDCDDSLIYTNLFTFANILYQFFVFFLTTQEDAEGIFLLALTFIVPVCSLSFFIPGFPTTGDTEDVSNIISVLFIMIGITFYRKGAMALAKENEEKEEVVGEESAGGMHAQSFMGVH